MDFWYNEVGKPLSSDDWLIAHHVAKIQERTEFAKKLLLKRPKVIVDLGCGTGLWLELIDSLVDYNCELIGIDLDDSSIIKAKERSAKWKNKSEFITCNINEHNRFPNADLFLMFNIFSYIKDLEIYLEHIRGKLHFNGDLAIRQYDGAAIRFGPLSHEKRMAIDNSLHSSVSGSERFYHYDMDRVYEAINKSSFGVIDIDFELFKRTSPFDNDFVEYYKNTIDWTMKYVSERAHKILHEWYDTFVLNHPSNNAYFFEVDLVGILSK